MAIAHISSGKNGRVLKKKRENSRPSSCSYNHFVENQIKVIRNSLAKCLSNICSMF